MKWYLRRLLKSTHHQGCRALLYGRWNPVSSYYAQLPMNARCYVRRQKVSRMKGGGSRPEHPTKKTPEVTSSNALRAQLVWYGFCRTQGFIVGSCGTFHSAVGSCGFFIVGSCSGNGLVFVMDLVARTEFLKLNVSTARIVSEWQRGSSMKRDGGVPASRR